MFHFKANRTTIDSSKKTLPRGFQNSPPFERSACFYVTINANFDCFLCFNFEIFFWKTETSLKKLKYRFWLEILRLTTQYFHTKTFLSEANVKLNRMRVTKWTYHKERSFTSNYFISLEILSQYKNFL